MREGDYGEYSCAAKNEKGFANSLKFQLQSKRCRCWQLLIVFDNRQRVGRVSFCWHRNGVRHLRFTVSGRTVCWLISTFVC